MGLESLGDTLVHHILPKVGPESSASLGCAGKRFRDLASEDCLWSKFCHDELHLQEPRGPFGNLCPSFKAAYQAWREAFRMYPWPLVVRGKRCWDRLKTWLSTNFPEALATLRKGASEDEINKLETSLEVKLPLPMRVLYRFCDGQELMNEKYSGDMLGSTLGLIGGYSFHNRLVNVYLLPFEEVITKTKAIEFGTRSKYIVVASSSTINRRIDKIFYFNCTNGQLYVGRQLYVGTRTRNHVTDGEMIPCVPNALISSGDGMLLWLEEHGHRLQNGIVKVRSEEKFKTINLFPEEAPLCSIAVTNGVKVRASAVFVPELSYLQDQSWTYFFSYSIRMSLLPEGCIVNGRTFNSCQPCRRRWIIRVDDTVVREFNDEAVIGKYPLLHPGQKEFVYERCSPQPTSSGSMEGSFTFFPGSLSSSLADPNRYQFEVVVARFPLQLPDYVF